VAAAHLFDPSAMQLPKAPEDDAVDVEGRRIDELAVHIMRRMQRPLERQRQSYPLEIKADNNL